MSTKIDEACFEIAICFKYLLDVNAAPPFFFFFGKKNALWIVAMFIFSCFVFREEEVPNCKAFLPLTRSATSGYMIDNVSATFP